MEQDLANLRLAEPNLSFGAEEIATPNVWFVQRFPEQYERFGSPFLEVHGPQIICASMNIDFFAACLGGRKDLNHHVIYFEPEMAFYFKDSDGVFKQTTAEKLGNLYRALLMKCAQDLPNTNPLNLFHEFRSDKYTKAVTNRAKSILAASAEFFGVSSPRQRKRGPELFERVARVFVDELLTKEPGQVLKLQDAYLHFLDLLKKRDLPGIKRSDFKAVVGPLIRDQFNVALRNDLRIEDKLGQRGWKDVKLVQTGPG